MRISNPSMRAIADAMERDEVLRWSNSLQRARVTRWGGMISTPDEVLQVCPLCANCMNLLFNLCLYSENDKENID